MKTGVKGFTRCHKAVLGTAKHGIQGFFILSLLSHAVASSSTSPISCKTKIF